MVNKFINIINEAYSGQDYSSAMGAGSLGLQKRERAAEKLPEQERQEFMERSNKQIRKGGIWYPALIGAHVLPTAELALIGDLTEGGIRLSNWKYGNFPVLENLKEEAGKKQHTQYKQFGGELTCNKLTLIPKQK